MSISLNGAVAQKPFPKAGDTRLVYCNGFAFKPISWTDKKTNALKTATLLNGSFLDEDGKEYEVGFGSSDAINLDILNALLEALNKPLIDETSLASLSLPDVGAVPADWAEAVNGVWAPDKKDAKFAKLSNFYRA